MRHRRRYRDGQGRTAAGVRDGLVFYSEQMGPFQCYQPLMWVDRIHTYQLAYLLHVDTIYSVRPAN